MMKDRAAITGSTLFLEQIRQYRVYVKGLSLEERLQSLELLQEQTYEILRVREANGGKPVPHDWQLWAESQKDIGLKK